MLILDGQTPSSFNDALVNNRVKRHLVRDAKMKRAPGGLGEGGTRCARVLRTNLTMTSF